MRFHSNSPFAQATISGFVKITFRDKVKGPNLKCTLAVVEDPGIPSTFALSYDDTSGGTLQVTVTAPTFQGTKIVPRGPNSAKPGCTGGPGVNIFSAPSSFNPLGQGDRVGLAKGGTRRYDRTWKWDHVFASATGVKPIRHYQAAIHTELAVVLTRR